MQVLLKIAIGVSWTVLLLLFYKMPDGYVISSQKKNHLPPAKTIAWNNASLSRISAPDNAAFYPRMVQLKDGSLLVVYSSNGNVAAQKSSNEGRTWSKPIIIAEKQKAVNKDTPDLLQLQNGDILVCYNSRPQHTTDNLSQPERKFDIRTKKSYDGGLTWKDERLLYEACSSFQDGCWEPAALQLPSGEIQLFFSDEGIYTTSNEQNISMLRSTDNGLTWSSAPQIISFRKGSRDGMPVPVWLAAQKRIVVAIEDPGYHNFKPYTIRSGYMGKWDHIIDGNDTARQYALAQTITDSIYAGAPYLRQLSTGETILSYQSTEGRKKNKDYNAIMRVAVGDEHATKFAAVTTPFTVPEGYNALWNSLCVLKGDTIIAVTSTNAYSKSKSEIWMIKGSVTDN